MSHELTEGREMALTFAREKMAPFAGEWDARKTLSVHTLHEAAALGLGGITARESFGGSGLKQLDPVLILETRAAGCPSVAAFLWIHNMAIWMVDVFASDELRGRPVTVEHIAEVLPHRIRADSDAGLLACAEDRSTVLIVAGVFGRSRLYQETFAGGSRARPC